MLDLANHPYTILALFFATAPATFGCFRPEEHPRYLIALAVAWAVWFLAGALGAILPILPTHFA